ncbi:PAC2 family protein [Arsenicicoccus sp. oral taxon 190]|uniref:PAC2 family protein n=1 Tax=Arsenicicoccus sp. oral taxon 190 TaxID=1658671 RepID=UPI00067A2A1F|nr:PAC2 family protein [Arsenicicoccus sp. oral taxon 190]AKT52759.1 proteasome protein [Arsenicicoccus sp. oral taxon 190]
MQDPTGLYRFETDCDPHHLRASSLVVAMGAFIDAGHTGRLIADHLLATLDHSVIASFDVDQMLDYRGRRPAMTFDRDRYTSYDDPAIVLYRVLDSDGTPFLLLTGPEPDYQWERMVEAVRGLVRAFGVTLTVGVHGIPMGVPHTRPIGVTQHASNPALIPDNTPVFGEVQVPASFAALLELRLGESGYDTIGYSLHVPHYLAQTDFADAALTGLRAVAGATGLALPTAELAAVAGVNREAIDSEIGDNEEVLQVVRALEGQYDQWTRGLDRPSLLAPSPEELPTADEIGAEFEQFLRTHDRGPGA